LIWFSVGVGVLVVIFLAWMLGSGNLVKVAIPRVAGSIAMGTRLDALSALKQAGLSADELRRLGDGSHDQDLLDRYWQIVDKGSSPP